MAFDHILPKPGLSEDKAEKPKTSDEKWLTAGKKKPYVAPPVNATPGMWRCPCGKQVFSHILYCSGCGRTRGQST